MKATTYAGINVKAMVLAVASDAFDDKCWCEELHESLLADIARNAKLAA
jgi:hypothetical protein